MSATATLTPALTATPSFTITPTFTISDTPLPTATAEVPAVLSHNVFRPELGAPLNIDFKPPQDGRVTVRVFNLAGELVRTPFDTDVKAGLWFQAQWNGTNPQGERVSAGVYVISVRGAGLESLRKVVLMK